MSFEDRLASRSLIVAGYSYVPQPTCPVAILIPFCVTRVASRRRALCLQRHQAGRYEKKPLVGGKKYQWIKDCNMKKTSVVLSMLLLCGCGTLMNDPMVPVTLSFSDNSPGTCTLQNKRGIWTVSMPSTASVRRSDDALRISCETSDGRKAVSTIESEMGAEIVASAVFLDLGITDAITDKHRKYAPSLVIPVAARTP